MSGKRALMILVGIVAAFIVSALLFPLTLVVIGGTGFLLVSDFRGGRSAITRSRVWSGVPWLSRANPVAGGLVLLGWAAAATLFGIGGYTGGSGNHTATTPPTAEPARSFWPPHTESDLRRLAAFAPAELPIIRREGTSFPHCTCRLSALVPRGMPRKMQAALLLKTFYDHHLDNFDRGVSLDIGGTVLFGYYSRRDMTAQGSLGGAFTAGAVHLDYDHGAWTMSISTADAFHDNPIKVHY